MTTKKASPKHESPNCLSNINWSALKNSVSSVYTQKQTKNRLIRLFLHVCTEIHTYVTIKMVMFLHFKPWIDQQLLPSKKESVFSKSP